MYKKTMLFVLAASLIAFAGYARADMYEFTGADGVVVLEYTAGSGSSTAFLVVDFGDAAGSYAFGYNWDGGVTGLNMLNSVAGAGGFAYTSSGAGATFAVQSISYDGNTYAGEFTTGLWQYFVSDSGDNTDWGSSGGTTAATEVLNDGDWNGYAIGGAFGAAGDTPTTPVPEPASGILVALGGALLAARRHRRKA